MKMDTKIVFFVFFKTLSSKNNDHTSKLALTFQYLVKFHSETDSHAMYRYILKELLIKRKRVNNK